MITQITLRNIVTYHNIVINIEYLLARHLIAVSIAAIAVMCNFIDYSDKYEEFAYDYAAVRRSNRREIKMAKKIALNIASSNKTSAENLASKPIFLTDSYDIRYLLFFV